jgi:tetratricopeptide (TPR) repeat protein
MRGKIAIVGFVLALTSGVAIADVVHDCLQDRRPEVSSEAALLACTEIIMNPSFGPDEKALAYRYRGEARTNAGAVQPAIADFSESIRIKKDNTDAFAGRGRAKFTAGNRAGAIADYSEAIRLSPGLAELYIERGHAYTVSGKTEDAIHDLTEAIRLNPSSARAFSERGAAYVTRGELVQGQIDYTSGIALFPFPEIYLNRGYVYEALGRRTEAIEDFRKALRSDPSLVDAGVALKRMGVVGETNETDQLVREGKALAEKRCGSCHAVEAKGASPDKSAPEFLKLSLRHPLFALRTPITQSIHAAHDQMPNFKSSDDEIDMIVAYINSLSAVQ